MKTYPKKKANRRWREPLEKKKKKRTESKANETPIFLK